MGQFTVACESTCTCESSGFVECGPRCEAPFQPARSESERDPFCVEQFVGEEEDKCCVIVTCAGNAGQDELEGPCRGIKV